MSNMQYKSCGLSIKDVDSKARTVVGYFAEFGSLDSDGDIFVPGAFRKTIAENGPGSAADRIKYLWQHDIWKPIGKLSVLEEDDKGLRFEATMSKSRAGQDAMIYYEEKIIGEHSVGYRTLKEDRPEEQGANYLKEVALWEGSAVTWGANQNTPLESIKSLDREAQIKSLDDQFNAMSRVLRHGDISDDMGHSLEIGLRQIQTTIKALTQAATTAPAPDEPRELDLLKVWRSIN